MAFPQRNRLPVKMNLDHEVPSEYCQQYRREAIPLFVLQHDSTDDESQSQYAHLP